MNTAGLTGPLPVSIRNIYLFRALLQRNSCFRSAFVSNILGCGIDTIEHTCLLNPMILGTPLSRRLCGSEILVSFRGGDSVKIRLDASEWSMLDLDHECVSKALSGDLLERLISASTWEELLSLSGRSACVRSAVETAAELLSDPAVLAQCRQTS